MKSKIAKLPATTISTVCLTVCLGSSLSAQELEFSQVSAGTENRLSLPDDSARTSKTPALPKTFLLLTAGGLAVGAALALAGGGDSGGNSGGGSRVAPEPGPAPLQRPFRLVPETGLDPAVFETKEYRRDYSLGMINASTRYADGGTGWGTLLSVFDTGADVDHADLAPNMAYTKSYFGTGQKVTDHDGHGTHVASIMAAAKNDFGMHGVAFDSRLAVFQGLGWEGGPSHETGMRNSLADAQRTSARIGAAAINHSWVFVNDQQNERLITEFNRDSLRAYLGTDLLSAFQDSVDADMITLFAAGNSGLDQVSVMAGLPALLPEFGSHWLGVGAVSPDGQIAGYSNHCGVAKDFCLVAPGSTIYGALSSDAGTW